MKIGLHDVCPRSRTHRSLPDAFSSKNQNQSFVLLNRFYQISFEWLVLCVLSRSPVGAGIHFFSISLVNFFPKINLCFHKPRSNLWRSTCWRFTKSLLKVKTAQKARIFGREHLKGDPSTVNSQLPAECGGVENPQNAPCTKTLFVFKWIPTKVVPHSWYT